MGKIKEELTVIILEMKLKLNVNGVTEEMTDLGSVDITML